MAVGEVSVPDAHAALWFEPELRPCFEAWPQQQLDPDRPRVARAAQRSGYAPRVGSVELWLLEEEAACDLDPVVACTLSPPIWEGVEQGSAQSDHAGERADQARDAHWGCLRVFAERQWRGRANRKRLGNRRGHRVDAHVSVHRRRGVWRLRGGHRRDRDAVDVDRQRFEEIVIVRSLYPHRGPPGGQPKRTLRSPVPAAEPCGTQTITMSTALDACPPAEHRTAPFDAARHVGGKRLLGRWRRGAVEEPLVHFLGQLIDRASEVGVLDEKRVDVVVVAVRLCLLKRSLPVLADHDEG